MKKGQMDPCAQHLRTAIRCATFTWMDHATSRRTLPKSEKGWLVREAMASPDPRRFWGHKKISWFSDMLDIHENPAWAQKRLRKVRAHTSPGLCEDLQDAYD